MVADIKQKMTRGTFISYKKALIKLHTYSYIHRTREDYTVSALWACPYLAKASMFHGVGLKSKNWNQ